MQKNNQIFVDKTDFIDEINKRIEDSDKFLAFTRPRRFGKSVTADMLVSYYSKGCDSSGLFRGLKISEKESYPEHLNKYNVIYWDMNSILGGYRDYLTDHKNSASGVAEDIVDFFKVPDHQVTVRSCIL